ncbi:DUF1588 domain-containing protein [Verrucomicrobium sp. BvORR034]|uniref:DUF1588 domain-containing protein n=1 Tax=Verrucomicrobium sp. BvORR034 TaxID=1396418 RepID=UPI000679D7DF|nr:DUF1588 domain-containing protein [Verrucomicrobium sp. BvORR034]
MPRFLLPALPLSALLLAAPASCTLAASAVAVPPPNAVQAMIENRCTDCHDAETKKGSLDLTALAFDLKNPKAYARWVKVFDRVEAGEMPPKGKAQPDEAALKGFLGQLGSKLIESDSQRAVTDGRATVRRMNRYEYENTVRDLLKAPWLQIKDKLPEDGEANRFNKVGDALDVSHVQMARYLTAADYALREVMADQQSRPSSKPVRYYARSEPSMVKKMFFSEFNRSPVRATFPILGYTAQPEVRAGKAPATAGEKDAAIRDQEAIGVVASSYEPIELRFNTFKAPRSGRYKLRFNAYAVWVGPGAEKAWWQPNLDVVSKGRRSEPVTIYSETPPRLLRLLGSFDVGVEPTVREIDTYLLKGETIRWDAVRLFRSRPPAPRNPLAEKDGQPGVAFKWMEVEGPLLQSWPDAGHKVLFENLPATRKDAKSPITVESKDPQDAERLLRRFLDRAYRQPCDEEDVKIFLGIIQKARGEGLDFANAMLAGYTAVLCSPKFFCLEEKPGKLDQSALASRLAYFLWNSAPDEALLKADLSDPKVLHQQTDRLLNNPKSRQFVDAFLNYWLDLRKMGATSPDAELYPDYYLDDLLIESAMLETQLFFAEMLKSNLPARTVIDSDFAMLNERLAQHYGLPPVQGVAVRKVALPKGSVRGGLMTQASVLSVTANGTTTSPVVRGVWIMERIVGKVPPPPPPSVPAIEPDTRGAHTIREQLEKHRAQQSCALCHTKIDPAGFALENFDVMGGWREQYRAMGEGTSPPGYGKNGQRFAFHAAQNVDASGELPNGGGAFKDIRGLKDLLVKDETQIARNLTSQLITYSTGAPVRFGDRAVVEQILQGTAADGYRLRSLIHALVGTDLFQSK